MALRSWSAGISRMDHQQGLCRIPRYSAGKQGRLSGDSGVCRSYGNPFCSWLLISGIAADQKPFEQAAFEALQAANRPILIDVRADWCPTCKRQAPIITSLLMSPEFAGYTVLDVNFDTQPAVLRQFKVTQQSTLIAFKGSAEVGRSTGQTDKAELAALFDKAL